MLAGTEKGKEKCPMKCVICNGPFDHRGMVLQSREDPDEEHFMCRACVDAYNARNPDAQLLCCECGDDDT